MKPLYYYLLIIDGGIYFLFVVLLIIYRPSDWMTWITISAQLAGAFAAIAAAIIALAIADRPSQVVNFTITMEVNKDEKITYDDIDIASSDLSPKEIEESVESIISYVGSYQVYFNITNVSGFTLNKPVVAFELPKKLRYPHKLSDGKWSLYFPSNLNNVPYVQQLEFGDRIVLSNNIVPYFNNEQDLDIWIRMGLSEDDKSEYPIKVSLNCDNAEGKTVPTEISPKKLLEGIGEVKEDS